MREMVLNHASVSAPRADHRAVADWLAGVADGMAVLVRDRIVSNGLRMARYYHEVPCLPGYSLFDAVAGLRALNRRDEYAFLMRLAAKLPLLEGVEREYADRFHACEEQTLPLEDGAPLMFCVVAGAIAVGLPSAPVWDRDRVTVQFDELLPDETIERASEEIDQLTRPAHARAIGARYRDRLREAGDPRTLWENRQAIFPSLAFGPDVREHLLAYARLLQPILEKLADLDRSAAEWRGAGGPAPVWRTEVTPESSGTMKNPELRRRRVFRSHRGGTALFEWHARFGGGGRIHLRFDAESSEVEIGYVGPHLPLRRGE